MKSMKIAIVWEGVYAGGVDSYLSYLLNYWPVNDEFVLYYNSENQGVARLQDLLEYRRIRFVPVPTVIRYFDASSPLLMIKKLMVHIFLPLLFIVNVLSYRRLFLRSKPDVVMCQNGGYPGSYAVTSAVFGAFLAGVKKNTMIIHHRANAPRFGHAFFRYYIEYFFSKISGRIIAISEATKTTILDETHFYQGDSDHIVVIPNGVPDAENKRLKLPKSNCPLRIGTIGRLDPHKGHEDLLEAVASLSVEIKQNLTISFIGSYSPEDYERVHRKINEFRLSEIVTICGFVNKPINEILLNLDLLAMTTKDFEGFGLTVVEALNTGIPVLATSVGIVPELLGAKYPLAVRPGDVEAITVAIETYFELDEKISIITPEIRRNLQKYDPKNVSTSYREHLVG